METTRKDLLKPYYVELIYKTSIKSTDRIRINDPDGVYLLAKEILEDRMEHHEEVYLILLNQASKILGVALVSKGGISNTVVDLRIIFQAAILANASRIILVHNHPSGNLKPSLQDDKITKRVYQVASILGIELTDHLIISEESYYSYAIEGRIDVMNPSRDDYSSPFLNLDEVVLPIH